MKRNFLPLAALLFFFAVLLIVTGMFYFSPFPVSGMPAPVFLPVFRFLR